MDCLGEPIATPNAFGLYLLAKRMKGCTRLALSGTGADEILGGYQGLYFGASRSLANRTASEFLHSFMDFDKGNCDPTSLLRPELRIADRLWGLTDAALLRHSGVRNNVLNQIASFELAFALPYWELDQADRIFMSQSIEMRPSFLENRFVDYCLAIPSHQKRQKEPLRRAMRRHLPGAIADRKKVASLSTPDSLVKAPWFVDLVEDVKSSPSDLWDQNALASFFSPQTKNRSFDVLYRVVMLHSWLKRHASIVSHVSPTK
ncbi:MAG: asparagine synthase [Rhodocyclaceae bacterium]|nr:asparagine synthase [Rhodocyclaceae bacterium]